MRFASSVAAMSAGQPISIVSSRQGSKSSTCTSHAKIVPIAYPFSSALPSINCCAPVCRDFALEVYDQRATGDLHGAVVEQQRLHVLEARVLREVQSASLAFR